MLLPILVTLLLGIWEVGRMIEIQQILSNAAREGARQAATGLQSNAQVEQVVRSYLQNEGLPISNVTVTVTNVTAPGVDAASAVQFDKLQVVVSLPLSDVRWSNTSLLTNAGTRVTGEALWYSTKDKDFPEGGDPAIE